MVVCGLYHVQEAKQQTLTYSLFSASFALNLQLFWKGRPINKILETLISNALLEEGYLFVC